MSVQSIRLFTDVTYQLTSSERTSRIVRISSALTIAIVKEWHILPKIRRSKSV